MSNEESIQVVLEQEGDYAFRIRFPGSSLDALLSDEPAPLGHDRGPNPARLLLASIANCLIASLLFALRKHRNEPGRLVAEINATPARNEQGRWRIPSAKVALHLPGSDVDYRDLERVLAQFEDFCVVTQSVRQGIAVDVSVFDGEGRMLLGGKSLEAGE